LLLVGPGLGGFADETCRVGFIKRFQKIGVTLGRGLASSRSFAAGVKSTSPPEAKALCVAGRGIDPQHDLMQPPT
jgi:hypothetical protein